jgi:GTP cyclohydrolase II
MLWHRMSFGVGLFADRTSVDVERAMFDFRAGRPVLIRSDGEMLLIVRVGALDEHLTAALSDLSDGRARLLLTPARLHLGLNGTDPAAVALPVIDLDRIYRLAFGDDGRLDATLVPISRIDEAAIELAQLSLVPRKVLAVPLRSTCLSRQGIIGVTLEEVFAYGNCKRRDLRIVTRAPVPLENAPEAEFVVFRSGAEVRDQVAVLVEAPNLAGPVNIEICSACLTGDLLGSLSYDRGAHLRGQVKRMAEEQGGILLYLDLPAPGLTDQTCATELLAQGCDAYDFDELLSADVGRRRLELAGAMLHLLGVKIVRYPTKNTWQIATLVKTGLTVTLEKRPRDRASAASGPNRRASRGEQGRHR